MNNKETLLDQKIGKNISYFESIFKNSSDIIFRTFLIEEKKAYLIYIDGMVNTKDIQEHVIHELLSYVELPEWSITHLKDSVLPIAQLTEETSLNTIKKNILDGNAALLIDGKKQAIIIEAKEFESRGISEPESEAAIRGPREGFVENLRVNTSLIRRKIRSEDLKILSQTVGEKTNTSLAIIYLDNVVDTKVLDELMNRLDRIEIDGVLESGYIEELIEDTPWSMFPQIQISERPDTVAANLLEGRIAIVVDGTPFVMILPATFWQQFQASEDYYDRYFVATFLRLIRLFFLGIAVLLPGLYVAITTYHHEMIPTNLLLSIAASREAIPFPAIVEAFIMEISFEALREAGVRLPKTIGQAVSILGALVIGTAAVEAGIVSAPMVIIVSITGIASFTIPKFSLAISIRLIRFPLMILGSLFGLFGIIIGGMLITAHLCKLRSFGVPYFSPVAPMKFKELRDIFIRIPIWMYNKRPDEFVKKDIQRQKENMAPSPNQGE